MKQFLCAIVFIFCLLLSPTSSSQNSQDSLNHTNPELASELNNNTNTTLVRDTTITANNTEQQKQQTVVNTKETIIPSQGFSFSSLWRGILGMISLVFIAFLFSSNRKAINWRVVGIGLTFQLVIAIGVLKVGFVKSVFEIVGKLFVKILNFTQAGSKFLFEGLVVDMDTFGFIFAFQVLPTIIFFSALTSVLYYLGVIQIIVKGFGWLLSKLLKISGAESLSVAGNIF